MNHRRSLLVFGAIVGCCATTLGFGSLMSGCGEYDAPPPEAAGMGGSGAVGGSGGQGPAGTTGMGGAGTGGGAGVSATGGSSGSAGQAGTAGSATGSGGVSGSGSGGIGAEGGAGPTEASCDNVVACGGDLVGKWSVVDSCLKISGDLDLTGLGADCKSATVTGTLAVTGTFTVNSDGTYTDETITTGEELIELPHTCLTLSATSTTCAKIGRPLTSVGYLTATCVDNPATTGCSCTATVEQTGGLGMVSTAPATSGTNTVADDVLAVSDGIRDALYPYCVAATTLTLSPPSMTKTGTSTGTILLEKQ